MSQNSNPEKNLNDDEQLLFSWFDALEDANREYRLQTDPESITRKYTLESNNDLWTDLEDDVSDK